MVLIPSPAPAALVLLGILLIMAGMMLLVLGRRPETEGGGIIMIGPIPIVFGTSKKIVRVLIIAGAALFIILLLVSAFAG